MLFEGDANRDDSRQQSTVAQRMNRERFMWFQEYQQARRPRKSLEEFLTSETLFQTSTLDAYSEAWALTFFLAETRPSNLSGYLKKLANRTELGEYSAMKRLNDFNFCVRFALHMLKARSCKSQTKAPMKDESDFHDY